jgi:peptide/nickel transport system substrate-binding protein
MAEAQDRGIGAKPVTRRTVIKSAGAAALALPVMSSPTWAAPSIRAATPKTLRIAYAQSTPSESLDPASPNRVNALFLLYNRLVRPDAKGLPTPDLALSWGSNAGGDVWTFKLRTGVRFHNGKQFTARDVVYTVDHVLDPATRSPGAAVLSTVLDRGAVTAVNPTTVRFRLKQPHADFPLLMMHFATSIIPEGSAATIGTTGIGTGPFREAEFVAGTRNTLQRFDRYWEGRPLLDRVVYIDIGDAQARTNALVANQVELLIDNLDFAAARTIAARSNLKVLEAPSGRWTTICMSANRPPFNDQRVREAMKLVIDPRQVIQAVLQGKGSPAGDNPVPLTDPYRQAITRVRNTSRARDLLRQAGHPNGIEVDLYTSPSEATMVSLAVVYAELAKDAGIKVNLKEISPDTYWNDNWRKEALFTGWWGERNADQVLNEIFRCASRNNESQWCNRQYGWALDRARTQLKLPARLAQYQKAQRLLVRNSGHIIPFFVNSQRGMSKRVTGYTARTDIVRWHRVGLT